MERIKHKRYGEGVIIDRRENKIIVKFDADGSERCFSFPQSFNLGLFELSESLQMEVDALNEMEKAAKAAKWEQIQVKTASPAPAHSKRQSSKKLAKSNITCAVEQDFQNFLIDSGYKEETDAGAPSTVYSYLKAIELILEEEHLTWQSLVGQISNVISLYDINGAKEELGNKSNKTWINALRRFEDFVNNSQNATTSNRITFGNYTS